MKPTNRPTSRREYVTEGVGVLRGGLVEARQILIALQTRGHRREGRRGITTSEECPNFDTSEAMGLVTSGGLPGRSGLRADV